jgi:Fic family protein
MRAFGRHVRDLVNQLDELSTTRSPNEIPDDIYLAASYAHCEIVRIHPFPNGNGRTARICINYFLARYGRLLIPIQRPQQDRYIEAAQAWIEHQTVEPFAAFLRSLAEAGQ